MLTDRQGDRAARAVNFIGELGSGRGRADDQHAAVLKLTGIAIVLSCQRGDRGWHAVGNAGTRATLQAPVASTMVRHRQSPLSVRTTKPPSEADTEVTVVLVLHRSRDRLRVTLEEFDDLRHGAVAVRVIAVIAKAGQAALPIGREQTQRIPALSAPALATSPRSITHGRSSVR